MAVRMGVIKDIKTFSDIRVCHFYLNYLNKYKNIPQENCNWQDAHSCMMAVNRMVIRYSPDKHQQEQLLAETEAACGENILPREAFEWINENERTAFWLWGYLRQNGDYATGLYPPENNTGNFRNWYHRLNLSDSPRNHQERMLLITRFFDGIFVPTGQGLKNRVMEQLKNKWKGILNQPEPVKWLPDDEASVSWVWDTLKKHQEPATPAPALMLPWEVPGLTTWFTPMSHAEKLLAVRAAFDLWDEQPDSKRLFLLNLNKAWNQRKLRQSRTDKKALNTYLKNDTRMRLDILAAHYDMRISDVLEKLINEHYRQALPPAE